MQSQPTAGASLAPPSRPTAWTGKVLGLGVTDILRVELESVQVPWLVEQLDVLRYVYEDTVVHDRARWEEIPEFAREARLPRVIEVEKDLEASEFDLRALDSIRRQLAGADGDETGPDLRAVADRRRAGARNHAPGGGEASGAPGGRSSG
jgi:hypothetical protein